MVSRDKNGKFWILTKMIRFYHGFCWYEFETPISSDWILGVIYLFCDASDLTEVVGKLRVTIE